MRFAGGGGGAAEARRLRAIRDVREALDDGRVTHLPTFPVDIIKIDRSFVADLELDGPVSVILGG